MTRFSSWLFWSALGVAASTACGSDDRAPAPGTGNAASGGEAAGGDASAGGTGGAADGGRGGADGSEAGAAGAAMGGDSSQAGSGAGGAPVSDGGVPGAGAPSYEPGACDPVATFGEGDAVPIDGVTDVRLLSMTSDERTIAFQSDDGDATRLYVADRATAEDPFGPPLEVDLPEGYSFDNGVTLSADGLRLVVTTEAHDTFADLTRAARGEPFEGEADESPYSRLALFASQSLSQFGWPLLSADDSQLYWVGYTTSSYVFQSPRDEEGAFQPPEQALDFFLLGGDEGEFKLLSGLSHDERAIFFYDEATGHAAARFRPRPGGPFSDFADLGERSGVAPNAACDALYGSVDVEGVSALLRHPKD